MAAIFRPKRILAPLQRIKSLHAPAIARMGDSGITATLQGVAVNANLSDLSDTTAMKLRGYVAERP